MKNLHALLNVHLVVILIPTGGLLTISTDLVGVFRDKKSDRFTLPDRRNCSEVPGISRISHDDNGARFCSCNATSSPILHFGVDQQFRNVVIGCFHHDQICPGNESISLILIHKVGVY